jgi:uncharacterized membrane protein
MFTLRWVINLFITTFVTMVMIFIIKKIAAKYQIPVVNDIAQQV